MGKIVVDIDSKYINFKEQIRAIVVNGGALTNGVEENQIFCNNRNRVSLITVENQRWVLKQYKRPIFINSIIYTFIRPNKAIRAYRYAKRLLAMGVETPYPVAYMASFRWGLFDIGYFISEYSNYRQLYDTEGLSEERQSALYRAFTNFTVEIHKKKICHPDYNPGNILWHCNEAGEFKFMLVDINRLSFGKKSPVPYIKSLAEEHLPATLLEEYSALMGYDISRVREIVEKKRQSKRRNLKIKALLRKKKR